MFFEGRRVSKGRELIASFDPSAIEPNTALNSNSLAWFLSALLSTNPTFWVMTQDDFYVTSDILFDF